MLQYLRKDISRTLLAFATMLWVGLGGSVVAIAQGPGRDADKPKPDFPGLDIQVEAGWDGRVEVNAPVPISFLLSNQSEQVLEGQLILTWDKALPDSKGSSVHHLLVSIQETFTW